MTLRVIVVEDSRLAREGLIRMLREFSELQVVGQAEHVAAARELVESLQPDAIFLDIHMPGETGFDLLEQLSSLPRIIFTTAYSEYAIRSFDYNTVDYLLKPIGQERLAQAVRKLIDAGPVELTAEEPSPASSAPLAITDKIFMKDGERCHLIGLESIRYIESCKNYVLVFFGDQRAYVKKSLNSVEERLPPKHFFRISRQHIANLEAIRGVQETVGGGYELTLDNGTVLAVSRRNAGLLKDLLSL